MTSRVGFWERGDDASGQLCFVLMNVFVAAVDVFIRGVMWVLAVKSMLYSDACN